MRLTCEKVVERNRQLMAGTLSASDEADLGDHIDSCSCCREAFEQIGSGDEWIGVGDALRVGGLTEPLDDSRNSPFRFDTFLSCLSPSDDENSLGRIGNMEIKGVIGHGGAGIVYKAHDVALGRTVAVKLLNPVAATQETARSRFAREARAMAAVRHESVVPVHAVSEYNDLPYLVMEYVTGGTLARRIEEQGPLSTIETVRVGLQMAQGLAAAHRHGVIHRDVKPSNILLDPGVERVRVADFGLATALDGQQHTETGLLVGTPQYMSPEQVRGDELDGRSDLFSLGSVLYFCCTGKTPFETNSIYATMQLISNGEPTTANEANSAVPDWLSKLISRLHSRQPEDRLTGADELVEILERELAFLQQPNANPQPKRSWLPRNTRNTSRIKLLALGAFAMCCLCVTAFFIFGGQEFKLSPFTEVTYPTEDSANVRYDGKDYELVSINGHKTEDILKFCRDRYGDGAEKRFAEDLLEVLERMGDTYKTTARLALRDPKTRKVTNIAAARMTKANRQMVYLARNMKSPRQGRTRRAAELSPFTEVTYPSNDTIRVRYEGRPYELVSINDHKSADVLKFCRDRYKERAEKRFAEDLVQVLERMGDRVGSTVKLELRDVETRRVKTVAKAKMTSENRRAVYLARNEKGAKPAPVPPKQTRRRFRKLSPFTEVTHPSKETAVVRFEGKLYELVAIEGFSTTDVLAHCRRKYQSGWDKRFAEDLVEVLDGLGREIVRTVSLELRDPKTKEVRKIPKAAATEANRRAVYQARNPDEKNPNTPIGFYSETPDIKAQIAMLTWFQTVLQDRWSYYRAGTDLDKAIEDLRDRLSRKPGLSQNGFALHLNGIISKGIDGHASVGPFRLLPGKIPFLIEPVGDRYVAFLPDRSRFVDPKYPYIEKIDGISIDDWIAKAKDLVVNGSPQYIKRHSLRMLRSINHFRSLAEIEAKDTVELQLASASGTKTKVREEIDSRPPIYGTWPRTETRTLNNNIGYLRITRMDGDAAMEVRDWMKKWQNTRGLVVDVRDNGGGTREALLTLAGYLLGKDDEPRVVNAAKYRLFEEFPTTHLEARYMYRADSNEWDRAERKAIANFEATFKPRWEPNQDEFSAWHYLVLSHNESASHYDKPVVVLTNPKCFSATDIFVAGMKELPNVTIMGTATGGGSARTTSVRIGPGVNLRIGSMASFQVTGQLFDGVGVSPDIEVEPEPEYFIGKSDKTLDAAVSLLSK